MEIGVTLLVLAGFFFALYGMGATQGPSHVAQWRILDDRRERSGATWVNRFGERCAVCLDARYCRNVSGSGGSADSVDRSYCKRSRDAEARGTQIGELAVSDFWCANTGCSCNSFRLVFAEQDTLPTEYCCCINRFLYSLYNSLLQSRICFFRILFNCVRQDVSQSASFSNYCSWLRADQRGSVSVVAQSSRPGSSDLRGHRR